MAGPSEPDGPSTTPSSTTQAAPAAPETLRPVRVAAGVNLGDACESYYPRASRFAGEVGSTTLKVLVGTDGRAKDTRVELGSGSKNLDDAAIACVKEQGRFVPAVQNGATIESWQYMRWTWRLPGIPSPSAVQEDWPARVADAYGKGNFVEAATLLSPKASAGLAPAQLLLAQLYLNGQGVERSTEEAQHWLTRAAAQGDAQAAFMLGAFQATGKFAPADYGSAAKWLRIAAHEQSAPAAYMLAELYQKGLGVEQDPSKALAWMDAAIAYCNESCGDRIAIYRGGRRTLAATLSKEQLDAAARWDAPEGPTSLAVMKNRDALQRRGVNNLPDELSRRGARDAIVFLARIGTDGRVKESKLETADRSDQLVAITEELIRKGDYEPKRVDGTAVESWQTVRWVWAVDPGS
ncbi:MAG: TonB family protein [Proteobacteria bacterium]|nr:TonB family protein [Pseudomonadota bacterium]